MRPYIQSFLFFLWTVSFISITQAGELDDRVSSLLKGLDNEELKSKLEQCSGMDLKPTDFSISHRGAPLGYPEHTREGYIAAAEQGAGYIECDVTFTKDRELVCRHSQCDLHTTTNILDTELVQNCSVPPNPSSGTPFSDVKCCTSDITLAEFKMLKGRMDAGNKDAKTVEEYLSAVPKHRPEIKLAQGSLLSHKESIDLFKSLGVKMIPELKAPQVDMPFGGDYSQQDYANALVEEYRAAGVGADEVVLQSFNIDDVLHWLESTPEFGKRAAWLDGRYRDRSFNIAKSKSWKPSMKELADSGITTLAPPLWMLLDLDSDKNIVASQYAIDAKAAGLDLVAWTLERSGPLAGGGGWYHQTIKPAIRNDSDLFEVIDVLARDVGVVGAFSDWPATTSFYANCIGIN